MEREDPAWEQRSVLIFEKRKGNRRKESGFSWADWVWEADTNISGKGKQRKRGRIGERRGKKEYSLEAHERIVWKGGIEEGTWNTYREGEDWWTEKGLGSRFLSREKVQQPEIKQLEKKTCRYVSRFLLYHHLVLISPDLVFWKFILVVWCGRKGPQFDLLRLICLHTYAILIFLLIFF